MNEIPDKLYFKIGEVAKLAQVEPYVLRYWETEFKEINPVKSRSKQRLYRRKDIETVLWIKQLLYDEGFTIDGARKRLKELKELKGDRDDLKEGPMLLQSEPNRSDCLLRDVRGKLREMLNELEK